MEHGQLEGYSTFAGKSMPMNDKIFDFSMIGVQDKDDDGVQMKGAKVKFVKVNSNSLDGKWCVLLFMDNQASDLEIEEWQSFNAARKDFNEMNVKLLGVCTDSHIAVRNFMHNNYLQDIKFPIISDRDGDFSRSFGLLKIDKTKIGAEKFHAARAVVILNDNKEMVYLCLKNEKIASNPEEVMAIIKHMQQGKSQAEKPSELEENKKQGKDGDEKKADKGGKEKKSDDNNGEKKPDKDGKDKKPAKNGKDKRSDKNGKKKSSATGKPVADEGVASKGKPIADEGGEKKGDMEICECKELPYVHSKYIHDEKNDPYSTKNGAKKSESASHGKEK